MDKQLTRTAQLITEARQTQNLSLRDFGKALNISHQQAKNYENGQLPDRERIGEWITSETPWVRTLGLEIFGTQFAPLIQSILKPDTTSISTALGQSETAR